MAKRILPALTLGIITVLAVLFLTGTGSDDKNVLRETFAVDAIYYDSGHVEVSYLDKSGKTESVVLEILGMDESFQKTFSESEFIEVVPFPSLPKYGWQAHPVIFEIQHSEFGNVQLKTEIHDMDKPKPVVIYGS